MPEEKANLTAETAEVEKIIISARNPVTPSDCWEASVLDWQILCKLVEAGL